MKKTSTFQTISITVFIVLTVIGAIVLANPPEKENDEIAGAKGIVTIWGTFAQTGELTNFIQAFNKQYEDSGFGINYRAFDPRTFDRQIVEALASGKGPDILLLPDDLILRHADKIVPIPYSETFGQRQFRDSFVQASEYYLRSKGMLAFPFAIDPMVMYWNRDIFSSASVAQPPKFWDEFLLLTPKLTRTDRNLQITQSAVALGEYTNVKNAKNILAMLFLQSGSPVVYMQGDTPAVSLTMLPGGQQNPGVESSLRFFMDFANPQSMNYTWNRSRENSEDDFLAGNLAIFFDYASSYKRLKQKNPNLNFDVTLVPQRRNSETGLAKTEITIARLHGLAAMKSSKNLNTAFVAIRKLLEPNNAAAFARAFDLPPVRRDLLSKPPKEPELAVAYDSAIRSRTWLDPKPENTDKEFLDTVESVSSGRADVSAAASTLEGRLRDLIRPYLAQ